MVKTMENENKQEEIMLTGASLDTEDLTLDLTTRKQAFCSMKCESAEEKKRFFNAINNPEKRLGDCIGDTIKAVDLFVEVVQCTNKQTGEVQNQPRVVIVDEKGISYQCVSIGIYNAVKKLIAVYGVPTWTTPISIKVKQINKDTKKILTLLIA